MPTLFHLLRFYSSNASLCASLHPCVWKGQRGCCRYRPRVGQRRLRQRHWCPSGLA
jgi:hypothetical protein